jgi:hypothetical protein
MVWFGEIASSAVKDNMFNWPKEQLEVKYIIISTPFTFLSIGLEIYDYSN